MPLFRRILQFVPFFAGPIFGVMPVDPLYGQLYLYNFVIVAILLASWGGLLALLNQFFLSRKTSRANHSGKLKILAITLLALTLLFFVVATMTLARNSLPTKLFYLILALLALSALHLRAATTSPNDSALLTGFVLGFGHALLSIWIGIIDQGFDWIAIVPAIAVAALCSFHQVALVVEREGAKYFNTVEAEVSSKRKQGGLLALLPPADHPRRYARVYTAMLLLGPVALALLTSLEILPPPYLLPLIAVPIMTSNFQGIHLAKHSGSFPRELGRKSINFSILLLLLIILAGMV